MRLFLVPFKAEAKLLTAILPNCRTVPDNLFQQHWAFKGGEIISWNKAGAEALLANLEKIRDFTRFSSVILFGSSGALLPSLKLGDIFSCIEIMDSTGKSIKLPSLKQMPTARLFTSNAAIDATSERLELYEKYRADLVDMESFAFAKVVADNGLSPASAHIVRFVSDTKDEAFGGKFSDQIRLALAKYRNAFVEDTKS